MARDTSFHDYVVHDVLGEVPGIMSRGMFGGWGIFKEGLMFGLITGGELYFKIDDENIGLFESMDSYPFRFLKKGGKEVTLSYWNVSESVMEDREELMRLLGSSVDVAKRARKKK